MFFASFVFMRRKIFVFYATNPSNDLLTKYCNASGQRVNLDKSSVFFSKGCPENRRNLIKVALNVMNEMLNEKYLGMPSDVDKSKNGAFKYLKDRIWKNI
jgi:hypothetical protein